ncbi:hypothetical protein TWF730_007010 [Orbilia blumenaviensis]|uniref:Uncharacterized protein n=1 Tax=Orbilia blumenaviensis TaxID=1796055 RepID=A0AAV9VM80_9PEZI
MSDLSSNADLIRALRLTGVGSDRSEIHSPKQPKRSLIFELDDENKPVNVIPGWDSRDQVESREDGTRLPYDPRSRDVSEVSSSGQEGPRFKVRVLWSVSHGRSTNSQNFNCTIVNVKAPDLYSMLWYSLRWFPFFAGKVAYGNWRVFKEYYCGPLVRIRRLINIYEARMHLPADSLQVFWNDCVVDTDRRFMSVLSIMEALDNCERDTFGYATVDLDVAPFPCEVCRHRHVTKNCFATGLGPAALFGETKSRETEDYEDEDCGISDHDMEDHEIEDCEMQDCD